MLAASVTFGEAERLGRALDAKMCGGSREGAPVEPAGADDDVFGDGVLRGGVIDGATRCRRGRGGGEEEEAGGGTEGEEEEEEGARGGRARDETEEDERPPNPSEREKRVLMRVGAGLRGGCTIRTPAVY